MADFIDKYNLNINTVKRVLIGLFVFLVLFLFILLVRNTFAQVTPVKEVSFLSNNSSYVDNVGGSFKVVEKVKWSSSNEAIVNFKLSTNPYENGKDKDIILVINDSNFVNRDSYNKLKDALKVNVKSILSNSKNKIALVTYDSNSKILSYLNNNYNSLITNINSIGINRGTNYYAGLSSVDEILNDYKFKNDREVIVLMTMNSYPTLNSPMEVSEFNYLKEKYDKVKFIAVQYDLKNEILDEVRNISDENYLANTNNIDKIINIVSKRPTKYNEFIINEEIDDKYFDIVGNINSDIGKVKKDGNLIKWDLSKELISGFDGEISFKIKLNDKYRNLDGLFNVSKNINITSSIGNIKDNVSSENSPTIKNNYDVIYDPNPPKGCVLRNVPTTKSYSIFDMVKVKNNELNCEGYQFEGWEIVNTVKKVNDDYFIMGEDNVIIRGTWSKLKVNLSMEGSVHSSLGIYDLLKANEVNDSYSNGIHSLSKTNNPIYYYQGKSNNNIILGGYCFKIVRTTKTHGVKIIYNGVSSNNKCINTSDDYYMSNYNFNKYSHSLSDVAYMYGERISIGKIKNDKYKFSEKIEYSNGIYKLIDSKEELSNETRYTCLDDEDSCDKVYYITSYDNNNINYLMLHGDKNINELLDRVFSNNNDSYIKYYIDNWYKNRLIKYSRYFEDTTYCNDRSVDNNFVFNSYKRFDEKNLSLDCSKVDSFSVSKKIGNGALTYPIGMLSIDEAMLTKGSIDNGKNFYLMSPYNYNGSSYVFTYKGNELVSNNNIYVRPVISLKGNVKVIDGMGTKDNPYIIKLI